MNHTNKTFYKNKVFWLVVLVVLIMIVGLLYYLFSKSNLLIYGTWQCSSGTEIVLSRNKKFEMYDSNDQDRLHVIGKFSIDETSKKDRTTKYLITMKTNDRTVLGKKVTDDYTTQYEIAMDDTDSQKMTLINTVSYSIYSCEKCSDCSR